MSPIFIILTIVLFSLLFAMVVAIIRWMNDDLNKKLALKESKKVVMPRSEETEEFKKQLEAVILLRMELEKIIFAQSHGILSGSLHDTRLREYTREGNIPTPKEQDVYTLRKSKNIPIKDLQTCR